jgi:lipopolysaccharide export LptBFGC system permease protein LptF
MKTKLSNNTLLKFFNKELSDQEMKHVGSIINNSEKYERMLNELKATYSLTNVNKKLETNPYLYMEIINKITKTESQRSIYNLYFIKRFFQPIIAISLILITLYTGYTIGNIHTETTNKLTDLNYTSEIYFNDLHLEKIETVLLMKD